MENRLYIFDEDVWKNFRNKKVIINPRYYMVKDLINNYFNKFSNKNEIISILGEPDNSFNNIIRYDIGVSPFGIKFEYLVIIFNDKEKIEKAIMQRN